MSDFEMPAGWEPAAVFLSQDENIIATDAQRTAIAINFFISLE
jgi:hypothetical protein